MLKQFLDDDFDLWLKNFLKKNLKTLNFSFASFGVFSLKDGSTCTKDIFLPRQEELDEEVYYDLSSLSKPLINSMLALKFEKQLLPEHFLLLNHQAGLPAYGPLSSLTWQEHVNSFAIKKTKTIYSDYSALRFMLETQKQCGITFKTEVEKFYRDLLWHWLDHEHLPHRIAPSGFRNRKVISGEVHDPNAYNLKVFCSHAGLFASARGLMQALIKLENDLELSLNLKQRIQVANDNNNAQRFHLGFDTVADPQNTLAGRGCSPNTIGHLGFTGTAFWIDLNKMLGYVLLTNATERFWYSREFLSELRRSYGSYVWNKISE